jgi:hypothetical protein
VRIRAARERLIVADWTAASAWESWLADKSEATRHALKAAIGERFAAADEFAEIVKRDRAGVLVSEEAR